MDVISTPNKPSLVLHDPITIPINIPTHSLNPVEPTDQADRKGPQTKQDVAHVPLITYSESLKIDIALMGGTHYTVPNSWLKGFKLKLPAVAEYIFKSLASW